MDFLRRAWALWDPVSEIKIKNKEEQDLEIHKLEQKLGLIRKNNKALHYDPHYYKINLIFISN